MKKLLANTNTATWKHTSRVQHLTQQETQQLFAMTNTTWKLINLMQHRMQKWQNCNVMQPGSTATQCSATQHGNISTIQRWTKHEKYQLKTVPNERWKPVRGCNTSPLTICRSVCVCARTCMNDCIWIHSHSLCAAEISMSHASWPLCTMSWWTQAWRDQPHLLSIIMITTFKVHLDLWFTWTCISHQSLNISCYTSNTVTQCSSFTEVPCSASSLLQCHCQRPPSGYFFNHLSLIWSQRFSLSQTLSSDCFINGLLQQTLTTTLRLAYLFDHSMYKNNSLYFLIIVAVFNSNITINFILTFYWKCHHSEPVKKKMAHFSI